MKKALILAFFMVISSLSAFAISLKIEDYGRTATLTDSKLILENDLAGIEEYDITWNFIDKLAFISFNYTGNNIYHITRESRGLKKYLILYGKPFINLYDENGKLVYSILGFKYTMKIEFNVTATSALVERDIAYSASNIINWDNLVPWVEANRNDGVGERITYIPKYVFDAPEITLIISNGFVDYKRPHLYENNNRIKKIRVYNKGHNEFRDLEIDDTPNYQGFYLDFKNIPTSIEIEILEIYKGTRFNDTSVNLLMLGGF
jgi:hypothetical protein